MKSVLLTAAAAFALLAGTASAQVSGYVGGSLGTLTLGPASGTTYGLNAGIFAPLGTVNVAANGSVDWISAGGTDIAKFTLDLHAFVRNPTWAGGFFVSYDHVDIPFTGSHVGGEAAWFFASHWALVGSAGYGNVDAGGSGGGLTFVRGGVAGFLSPQVRAEGHLGYSSLSDGATSLSFWTANLDFEAGLGSMPLSLFANARHVFGSDLAGITITDLKAGIRYRFGTATLEDEGFIFRSAPTLY